MKTDFKTKVAYLDDKLKTDDTFINALELINDEKTYFTDKLINDANTKIEKFNLIKYLEFDYLKKLLKKNIVFIILISLYIIFLPKNFLLTSSRVLLPWKDFSKSLFLLDYDVLPKNKKILSGSSQEVNLIVSDKIKKAIIYYRGNQTKYILDNMNFKTNIKEKFIYSFVINDITQDIDYFIKIYSRELKDIINTKKYSLKVIDYPIIENVNIKYRYPSYIGSGEFLQENNGNIDALKGTKILINAIANHNIKKAEIIINNNKYLCKVNKNNIYYSFRANKDGEYFIKIYDVNKLTNPVPVHYSIKIKEDEKPEVYIINPGKDIEIDNSMSIPIKISGKDDYIIKSLEFYYYAKRVNYKNLIKTNIINLPIERKKEIEYSFEFNLDDIGLVPGDEVYYFAVIDDGYPYNDSHKIKSKIYKIKFPSLMDMYKSIDKEESTNISILSDILEKQREYEKKIAEIEKKIKEGKNLSFVDKQQLKSLLEEEKRILKETKKLTERLEKTIKKIEENKMNSMEIVEKMRKIQELLREVATREMQENIEKLQKMLENMKIDEKAKQKLAQKLDQKKLLEKLDNTLKMLKELKKQRKLNNISKKIENILKKQQEINKNTFDAQKNKNIDNEKLQDTANKQKSNKESLEDLKKSIEEFNKEYNKEDSEIKKDFEKSLQMISSNKTGQMMESAAKDIKQNKIQSAMKKQAKIMSQLMQLKNQLTKNIQQKQRQDLEKILNLLDNTIWNLIGISQEQNDVILSLRIKIDNDINLIKRNFFYYSLNDSLNKSYPDLAEKEIFLERNLMYNKKSFRDFIANLIFLPDEFYQQFSIISMKILSVKQNLEERNLYFSLRYAKESYRFLNILIFQIMNIKDNIKDQSKKSQQSGMSEELEQLGQSQQQLNQSTEQMMGQIGQNGEMSQQMQEYLQELAYQQQMIKNAFDNLIQNNEAGKFLGNSRKISEEMKKVAEELKKGNLNEEVIKRQKKILKKLLDSEKSLRVKEKSKKRKAETAEQNYLIQSPENIKKNKKKNRKFYYYREIEKYPEEYKELIENYLERIYK